MASSKIARRYARALADICQEDGSHSALAKQLSEFAAFYEGSDELQQAMRSPVIDPADKAAILDAVGTKALLADSTRRFLGTLLEAGRIDELGGVAEAFSEMLDDVEGRYQATVTSAIALDQGDLTRIQTSLERLTGKKVQVDSEVDESLLGGVKVQMGNTVVDASVRTGLERIRDQLLG